MVVHELLVTMALDTLYISTVHYVVLRFQLLDIEIRKLRLHQTEWSYISPGLKIDLKKCIKRHVNCIKLADDVEDIFNKCIFMQFLTTTIVLCVIMFVIRNVSTK